MKIIRLSLIIAAIAFLSSCHSTQAPQTASVHDALPEQFELVYSSSWGGYTKLVLENGYLARQTYEEKWIHGEPRNRLVKVEHFVPERADWLDFWDAAERLQIWKWKERYDPSDIKSEVFDGGGWHLVIKYRGKKIDTGGENAGPKPGNPEITVVGWDEWNLPLEGALSILLKKKG